MSLGNWDPNSAQVTNTYTVDKTQLQQFIAISRGGALDQPEHKLEGELSQEDIQSGAALMQLSKKQWLLLAEAWGDDDIEHLMRFFTVAEKLPGWEAGANSPVIWLGKTLKKRGTGINRDLLLWIKAHSDNKFLPHGPLL